MMKIHDDDDDDVYVFYIYMVVVFQLLNLLDIHQVYLLDYNQDMDIFYEEDHRMMENLDFGIDIVVLDVELV
jgi:hypothetical protein